MDNRLLGTLLGDSYIGANKGKYSFRSQHCPEQLDYLEHIADVIRSIYNKHVSVYYRSRRNIHELFFYDISFTEHRNKYYPNGKKSLPDILKDVTDPVVAVAYWLADDGCVHYSTQNPNYLSPRLLLATCSESYEDLIIIKQWFKDNFNFEPYIITQKSNVRQKSWYLLKFSVGDSYKLWHKVRHILLPFPSMKHKFRVVESQFRLEFYRIKYAQECPTSQVEENICRPNTNKEVLEIEDKKLQ